jgi:hypothetical protein
MNLRFLKLNPHLLQLAHHFFRDLNDARRFGRGEVVRNRGVNSFSGKPQADWTGQELLRAFNAFKTKVGRASNGRRKDRDLPALYPTSLPARGGT